MEMLAEQDRAMPDTLPKLLSHQAGTRGEHTAYREKEFGIWQSTSWRGYRQRVRDFSLGLVALGLERGDRVAILGDNRPEWMIAELATQAAGAVSLGVYQDSVAREAAFLIDFAGARFVVAEDQEQVDKLLAAMEPPTRSPPGEERAHSRAPLHASRTEERAHSRAPLHASRTEERARPTGEDRLPVVEKIIYDDPRGLRHYPQPFLVSFLEVEALGREHHRSRPGLFERNVEATAAGDVAVLAATSGTTGKPKLAMLTHFNLLSAARGLLQVDPMTPQDDLLSFLPMAWIGEQMLSIACGLTAGSTVNFPEEPETVRQDLKEIGPRTLFSPPRIWENMVSEVQVKIEDATWLKRRVFEWAFEVGHAAAEARRRERRLPRGLRRRERWAQWLCFFWIKDKLGLRRLRQAYTGGAALGPDVFRFFHAMGVNFKQIYGQTEISGISAAHRDGDVKFQTVGPALPHVEIRVAEGGEILTRGPAVFTGYFDNPEATADALADGWLRSGDAGYFDRDGHLVVIDRAEDVMKLDDGTSFSPQFLENKLKFSPYVHEAVAFGGGERPFVAALVVIDYANAGKWAEKRQIPYTTFTDLAQKPELYALARRHVEAINDDLPEAARVRRFLLLHKELDADDAELTRTRKVRRRFVAERYGELVAALYGDRESVTVATEITYQDGRTANIETRLRIETLE